MSVREKINFCFSLELDVFKVALDNASMRVGNRNRDFSPLARFHTFSLTGILDESYRVTHDALLSQLIGDGRIESKIFAKHDFFHIDLDRKSTRLNSSH